MSDPAEDADKTLEHVLGYVSWLAEGSGSDRGVECVIVGVAPVGPRRDGSDVGGDVLFAEGRLEYRDDGLTRVGHRQVLEGELAAHASGQRAASGGPFDTDQVAQVRVQIVTAEMFDNPLVMMQRAEEKSEFRGRARLLQDGGPMVIDRTEAPSGEEMLYLLSLRRTGRL